MSISEKPFRKIVRQPFGYHKKGRTNKMKKTNLIRKTALRQQRRRGNNRLVRMSIQTLSLFHKTKRIFHTVFGLTSAPFSRSNNIISSLSRKAAKCKGVWKEIIRSESCFIFKEKTYLLEERHHKLRNMKRDSIFRLLVLNLMAHVSPLYHST